MELISISEISIETGIPKSTIRKYVKNFKNVLPEGIKSSKIKKYPMEISQKIKNIHTWTQEGLSKAKIEDNLTSQPQKQDKSSSRQYFEGSKIKLLLPKLGILHLSVDAF